MQGRVIKVADMLDKKAWAPEWQEAIVLLSGLLQTAEPLLGLLCDAAIDDTFRHRLAIAGKCLGELRDIGLYEQRLRQITGDIWRTYLAYGDSLGVIEATVMDAFPALVQVEGEVADGISFLQWLVADLRNTTTARRDMHGLRKVGFMAATGTVLDQLLDMLTERPGPVGSSLTADVLGSLGSMATGKVARRLEQKLREMLQNPDRDVKARAAEALGRMGTRAVSEELLDNLVEMLKCSDWLLQVSAAWAFAAWGPRAARNDVIDRFIEMLRAPDEDPGTAAEVTEALRRFGKKAASSNVKERLLTLLRARNIEVQGAAAGALGEIFGKSGDRAVLGLATAMLQGLDSEGHWLAVDILRAAGPRVATSTVVDRLIQIILDPRAEAVLIAAEALGELKPTAVRGEVIERVMQMVKWSPSAQKMCISTLSKMPSDAVRGPVIEQLIELLCDPDPSVQIGGAELLVAIGGEPGCGAVAERISALWTNPVCKYDAVPVLQKMMVQGARLFGEDRSLTVSWVGELSKIPIL